MYDRYLITAESVRNVVEAESIVGFAFEVRLGYYRGLGISMVEPFTISVDGERVNDSDVTFSVQGQTFTYQQMETRFDVVWGMREDATLTVRVAGGLAPGVHEIDLEEALRISYTPWVQKRHDRKLVQVS